MSSLYDVSAEYEGWDIIPSSTQKKIREAHQAAMLAMHTETSKKMKGYMEGLLNRASGFICSTIVDSIKPQFQWLKQIFDEASSDM